MNVNGFWSKKTRVRKYMSFTNRFLAVVEALKSEKGINEAEVIEELVKESPLFREIIEKMNREGFDVC